MITVRAFLPAVLLAAAFVGGCATETAGSADDATKDVIEDGLTLSSNTPDRVSGVYRRGPIGLVFESAIGGSEPVLTLTTLDGTELLRLVTDAETKTSSVMNGKLVVTVPREGSSANASVQGDRHALEEMHARPEAALIDELPQALADAGVGARLTEAVLTPQARRIADDLAGSEFERGGSSAPKCGTLDRVLCATYYGLCAGTCATAGTAVTAGGAAAIAIAACVAGCAVVVGGSVCTQCNK